MAPPLCCLFLFSLSVVCDDEHSDDDDDDALPPRKKGNRHLTANNAFAYAWSCLPSGDYLLTSARNS